LFSFKLSKTNISLNERYTSRRKFNEHKLVIFGRRTFEKKVFINKKMEGHKCIIDFIILFYS